MYGLEWKNIKHNNQIDGQAQFAVCSEEGRFHKRKKDRHLPTKQP